MSRGGFEPGESDRGGDPHSARSGRGCVLIRRPDRDNIKGRPACKPPGRRAIVGFVSPGDAAAKVARVAEAHPAGDRWVRFSRRPLAMGWLPCCRQTRPGRDVGFVFPRCLVPRLSISSHDPTRPRNRQSPSLRPAGLGSWPGKAVRGTWIDGRAARDRASRRGFGKMGGRGGDVGSGGRGCGASLEGTGEAGVRASLRGDFRPSVAPGACGIGVGDATRAGGGAARLRAGGVA